MDQTPIELSNLWRRYGEREALRGVDFDLAPGRIAGLVGPNGSGKTTLLKLLAGFLKPNAGQVRLFGFDPFRFRAKVMLKARFAFAPPALFEALTAREHLAHLAGLGGLPRPSAIELEHTIEMVGLRGRADEPVKAFSFGMRQRLGLAQALLPRPKLLVLDEPTDGLDPLAIIELREILKNLRSELGMAVLLSSHLLVEVDQLVDDMLVLQEGKCVFRGPPAELRSQGQELVLETSDNLRASAVFKQHGLEVADSSEPHLKLAVGAIELEAAAALLRAADLGLLSFRVERPTLEAALLERLRQSKPVH